MMTRKDYMAANSAGDGMKAFRAYYGEIVREVEAAGALRLPADVETIRQKLETDEHLNNISLGKWDSLAVQQKHRWRAAVMARDCQVSLSDGVCILKEAARQRVEALATT